MAKRIRSGDVLEIEDSDGLVYVHYLGRHPDYGDCIEVCPRKQALRPSDFAGLFHDAYVTFYPAAAAVSQRLGTVVGSVPPRPIPPRLRREGATRSDGSVAWLIEDSRGEVLKEKLSDEELLLPIVATWNHAMLLHRVAQGWRPEKDEALRADACARNPRPSSARGPLLLTRHYLYFTTHEAGGRVAERLRAEGFETEERPDADDRTWLVVASHRAAPGSAAVSSARDTMERLAAENGGEYDGSETGVGRG